MKKIHFILLLAGLLAVGSAFTTTKTHRDPCDGLSNPLVHRTANGWVGLSIEGECGETGTGCLYADTNNDGKGDIACDSKDIFVPNPPQVRTK